MDTALSTTRADTADLQAQLDAASKATNTASTQLNSEVAALKDQLSAAQSRLNTERSNTTKAHKETGWVWVDFQVGGFPPTMYSIAVNPTDIFGLIIQCSENGRNLYLWEDSAYEAKKYDAIAGFNDERLRVETVQGYEGDPSLLFTDIPASNLWRAKTFSLEDSFGTTVFDTAQLRRMFPTEKAFCNGETPKSN